MSALAKITRAFVLGFAVVAVAVAAGVPAAAAAPNVSSLRDAPATARCGADVEFGLIEATGCLESAGNGVWHSTGQVFLNGVELPLSAATALTLTEPAPGTTGGGNLKVSLLAPLEAARVAWTPKELNWNLPTGGKGDEKTVVSVPVPRQSLLGFELSGSASVAIGRDAVTDVRYVKFYGNLALPAVFKNGPGTKAGGLTATVGVRVDREGTHLDALKAMVDNAYIGQLQVKGLCLSYLAAGSTTSACHPPAGSAVDECAAAPLTAVRWSGNAQVVLPTPTRTGLGLFAGIQNGLFDYAGASVQGLAIPIATGVFLDGFGLSVCVTPHVAVQGTASINIGPTTQVSDAPVKLTGALTYVDSRPWRLTAQGTMSVFGTGGLSGKLSFTSNNTIDFGLNANFSLAPVRLSGQLQGWIVARKPYGFNVDGSGTVCISTSCKKGEVVVSTTGAAGCFSLVDFSYPWLVRDSNWEWYAPWRVSIKTVRVLIRGGAGVNWATRRTRLLGDSCDIGAFTQPRPTGGITSRNSVVVGANEPALVLSIQGASAVPRVQLLGPGGVRYTQPVSDSMIGSDVVWAADPAAKTTEVEVAKPRPGKWTVLPLAGTNVVTVRRAEPEKPAPILAAVGGTGYNRTLGYSYQPQAAHTIEFVEQGPGYDQDIGPATQHPCPPTRGLKTFYCGAIPFHPDTSASAASHTIYAVVTDENGVVSDERPVTSYLAPAEPEPSAINYLKVSRRVDDTLVVDWRGSTAPVPAAGPAAYNVDATLSDGRSLLEVASGTASSIAFAGFTRSMSAKVTVTPMRSDDTQGLATGGRLPVGFDSNTYTYTNR